MEEKEPYFQVPKSLFRSWRAGEINSTTFAVYMLMLDRYKISYLKENRNKFTDESGEIFFYYSYNSLADDLNITRRNEIAKAIQELEKIGLIKSKKVYGKATMYYITSNLNDTSTSNLNDTSTSNLNDTSTSNLNDTSTSNLNDTSTSNLNDTLIRINNNKNNINKNNINNSTECSSSFRNEIRLLIGMRKITVDRILKYCNNIERIKEVISYANKTNKGDGYIISALKENYNLKELNSNENTADPCNAGKKDYSMSITEALKLSRNKEKSTSNKLNRKKESPDQNREKDYNLTIDDVLNGGGKK
ncbi:replication initiator protein A [Fusobacterium nucleatum]|uniref:replication initiator protein A n=1 Tax=Fusobacterium nucleatum TaxID=851 RepID=UPI0030CBBCC7